MDDIVAEVRQEGDASGSGFQIDDEMVQTPARADSIVVARVVIGPITSNGGGTRPFDPQAGIRLVV